MYRNTCSQCHTEIPAGLAVLRTISFQRVAFHRDCWNARRSPTLPAQRQPKSASAEVRA